MIGCDGEVDKPYPLIIFNCQGNPDTNIHGSFIYKFNINDSLLVKFEKLIRQDPIPSDYALALETVFVRVVINKQVTVFYFGFKTFLSWLFKQIAQQFTGDKKQNVKIVLDQLSRRLGIPISD